LSLNAKQVIAVASGKGGVGKSTVAVNLAVALAQTGAKVGLLDADIYGPNIPTMMGVAALPAFSQDKIIPAEAYGVKLMSIGFLVKPGQPLIWRGPMLHSAIRQFLSDVVWGDLDYFIIDLPPGTGDAQLSLAQSIPITGGVIVTLPQDVSVEDASRGLYMFKQLDIPILGVIENMSYLELPDGQRMEIFGKGGGQRLANEAKTEFLGNIPMDSDVRKGGDGGKPIVSTNSNSNSAMALKTIANRLAAKLSILALENQAGIDLEIVG
jgi:ATP-binding protein involved in chromosome partitioning